MKRTLGDLAEGFVIGIIALAAGLTFLLLALRWPIVVIVAILLLR